MSNIKTNAKTTIIALVAITVLGGCTAAERISNIGKAPEMAKISNPTVDTNYQPVSLPMPSPKVAKTQSNSLWQSHRTTFFEDQRANDVGDIITVMIDIKDEAKIANETDRERASDEKSALNTLLGLEQTLATILPEAVDNTKLAAFDASGSYNGKGSIERDEEITLRMAALITQILPNGNMVIHGKQEVRVNFEKRVLKVDGVIRPEDVSVDNTISYDQIAEARIIYGGEGQINDMQQPRYGQQLYDILFPF